MEKRTKESRKRINSLILLVAFTAILLIVSTYAWFTTQKDVTLTNLRGTVEVAESMEISLDAKEWAQEIDLEGTALDDANTSMNAAKSGSGKNIVPPELLPVSLVDKGDSTTTLDLFRGTLNGKKLSDVYKIDEQEVVPTENDFGGVIAFDVFLRNSSRESTGTDDIQLNVNSAARVLQSNWSRTINGISKTYTGDAASGLQNTVRVGFALYGGADDVAETTKGQADILDKTTGKNISSLAIWEPNHKSHVAQVIDHFNKISTEIADNTAYATYGLKPEAEGTGARVADIWDTSDTTNLGEQKTVKTDKDSDYTIASTDPVQLKTTDGSTNFAIPKNKISKVRIYVWLEGQDYDCINWASYGGGIQLDIGLTKDFDKGDHT